jgi:ATP-dependent exoDNAse (exonuclease V) beta subunit
VSQNTVLDLDSELRVLYVACTRPREGLYLISSEGYYGHDEMVRTIKELVIE